MMKFAFLLDTDAYFTYFSLVPKLASFQWEYERIQQSSFDGPFPAS